MILLAPLMAELIGPAFQPSVHPFALSLTNLHISLCILSFDPLALESSLLCLAGLVF